jgi:hypothetical protein
MLTSGLGSPQVNAADSRAEARDDFSRVSATIFLPAVFGLPAL